jgi:hypothetical protein
MSGQRIYIVTAADGNATFVRAGNQAQALRYVARAAYTVRVATAIEVADVMDAGQKIETAFEADDAPFDNEPPSAG